MTTHSTPETDAELKQRLVNYQIKLYVWRQLEKDFGSIDRLEEEVDNLVWLLTDKPDTTE